MREFIHALIVDPGCNSEIPEKCLFWGLVFHGRRVWEFTDASCKYETCCIYGCARTELKWLLIYGSKHGKYWFSHIFHCNFTTMVSTEVNCDFWVPWNISDQIHRILCPKLLYFLRKCTKSSKIRPRPGVQYPLNRPTVGMTHELRLTHFLPCYTKSYKLKSRFQWSEIELYHKTYRYDLNKMFILHVKCNFDENFKDLLFYSNIFGERFFSRYPDRRPFFNQNGTHIPAN